MRFNKVKCQVLHLCQPQVVLQAGGRVAGRLLGRKAPGDAD